VTLLEFEGALPEEVLEQPGEPEEPASEGSAVEELPEYPDHRPSSFLKGKPRCMLSHLLYTHIIEYFYLFTSLSCRMLSENTCCIISTFSRYIT
jgi:hypothetical protein